MDTLIIMSGADNTITIPAVAVSKTNGGKIKAAIAANNIVNVTLKSAGNDLDGDLDNSIIAHEYTHGISNRLTGGPAASTCLMNKEQMGEGWSDYYALMMTTNWATSSVNDGSKPRPIGTYVTGEDPVTGGGIRTYPYTTNMSVNKWTYSMLAGIANSETHDVGEIWTATLWDMTWNIIQTDGINANLYNANAAGGNSIALKLVTFAMKIQPCSPGFLDGRDAILKADDILYNGKYHCAIWSAFARRGMGVKAKQGSSDNTTDQTADFSTPSAAIVKLHVDKSMAAQNDNLTYTYNVQAQCASIGNYKIVDTLPSNVTYVSGGTYNASDRTVTFQIANVNASESQDFTMKVRINSGTYFPSTTFFSETIPNNFIPFTLVVGMGSTWATSTINHSAPYSVFANNNTGAASEQILSSLISYGIAGHTQLSFWHNYNTEASHDGAVVELSVDNGTTWIDAGPYMSQNGYNSIINTNSNLTNKSAFSGSSSGFIQTIVNLSAFEGKSLKFRFRFVTDNSVASVGWYIDDITLTKEAAVYNLAGLYDNSGLLQNISDTVTIITSSALPIVWGDFTAEKIGKTALLKWNTLLEINTAKFSIERSGDGVHFTEIGSVNASGNSNVNMNYTITDGTPLSGSNFYRIRQTDRDGKYLYSEIRSLTFDQVKGMITISPNPAKDHITISISGNKESRQVVLLNTAGQALATFTVKEESNYLKIPSLAAGVYYIKISGSNASSIQKLVIEK
ncbi:MAG: M36 family metallopeptidase [Ginsengibacter sp.]